MLGLDILLVSVTPLDREFYPVHYNTREIPGELQK